MTENECYNQMMLAAADLSVVQNMVRMCNGSNDSKAQYWKMRLSAALNELGRTVTIYDCLHSGPTAETVKWISQMTSDALERFELGQAVLGGHLNGTLEIDKEFFRNMAEKEGV